MVQNPQQLFNVRTTLVRGKNLLVQRNIAYEIDEVGMDIWELCDGEHTLQQIAEVLTQTYNVAYEQAEQDCAEFIEDLKAKGLLQ